MSSPGTSTDNSSDNQIPTHHESRLTEEQEKVAQHALLAMGLVPRDQNRTPEEKLIAREIAVSLTANPHLQYQRSQGKLNLSHPYANPIQEFVHKSTIVGDPSAYNSEPPSETVISRSIGATDTDAIPPSSLFIGRIGQASEDDIQLAQLTFRSQRDFFLKVGYTDGKITKATMIATLFSLLATFFTFPLERARALAQADFASIASLQPPDAFAAISQNQKAINLHNKLKTNLLSHLNTNEQISKDISQLNVNTAASDAVIDTTLSAPKQSATKAVASKLTTMGKNQASKVISGVVGPNVVSIIAGHPIALNVQEVFEQQRKLIKAQQKIQHTLATAAQTLSRKERREIRRNAISPNLQLERRDNITAWLETHPNSTRAPILRPVSYDIFVRRRILEFDDAFREISQHPQYQYLSGPERAALVKASNPVGFANIGIVPYHQANIDLETNALQTVAPTKNVVKLVEQSAESATINAPAVAETATATTTTTTQSTTTTSTPSKTTSETAKSLIRPIEQDFVSPEDSDVRRGFHRFYAEKRLVSIRTALNQMFHFQGVKVWFQLQSLPLILRLCPFFFASTFVKPWRSFMTEVNGDATIAQAEFKMAAIHQQFNLTVFATLYPMYTILSRAAVNKTILYPQYNINVDPELQVWKEKFLQYHIANQTYRKYSVDPLPEIVASEEKEYRLKKEAKAAAAEKSAVDQVRASVESKLASQGKLASSTAAAIEDEAYEDAYLRRYTTKQRSFLESLLKKEGMRSRLRTVMNQICIVEGWGAFFRGWYPALFAVVVYFLAYIPTYALTGSQCIHWLHRFRAALVPSPPKNHPHDVMMEVAKAVVPFAISTTVAQFAAYPFTTIRNYVLAADSPGYVTMNKNAIPLVQSIASDQYRLPLRLVKPLRSSQQFKIAIHEIRRQAGWRGFWRGASIIPLVRVPVASTICGVMFYALHRAWPGCHEIIDAQHIWQDSPTLL